MSNFNFNKIMLGGRLTADPENKQTAGGTSVTSFTMAVNRPYRRNTEEKPPSDFFRVKAWGQTADFVARFFRRGSSIFVVGALQNSSYTDHQGTKRYVTEIVAEEVSFVDSKLNNTAGTSETTEESAKPAPLSSNFYSAEDFESIGKDDDLPF